LSRTSLKIPATIALAGVVYLVWPWLSFVTLSIFTDSMRRANVNSAHVLRCTLYSSDAGFVFGILVSFLAYAQLPDRHRIGWTTGFLFDTAEHCLLEATILFSVVTAVRLAFAYRLYLRFPHAVSTAVASQVILLLAVAAVILLTSG
jgi:hypothetical protein